MSHNGRVEEHLTVVKGRPTDEEVAAVVAAVAVQRRRTASARNAGASGARSGSGDGWAAYWLRVRRPVRPGPQAWRRSVLPD